MKLAHLTSQEYVVSQWSGGTTTQVGIAPAGAVYADRDFLWRISSATVDLEESDFTALPDYNRLISTLEGEIDLSHNGGEVMHFKPFQVHAFDGGWQTNSKGKCRDFNLMMRKGKCDGTMNPVEVRGAAVELPASQGAKDAANASSVLYCSEGTLTVTAQGQTITLQPTESVLTQEATGTLTVTGNGKGMFVEAWY